MPDPQRSHASAEAAYKVLVELFEILGPYPNLAVLVGGMEPWLEYNDAKERHQGTLDVDLVLARDGGPGPDLGRLLQDHGYTKRGDYDDFQYFRQVKGFDFPIRVDLLTARREGEGVRLVNIHGVRAFPLWGGDLAVQESHIRHLKGELPEKGSAEVDARIAGIVPFVVLKAFAIRDREDNKDKDPYDLYYCVRHFPGGLDALIREFTPFRDTNLVNEAATILEKAFENSKAFGPSILSKAAHLFPGSEPDQLALDASERILKLARGMKKLSD